MAELGGRVCRRSAGIPVSARLSWRGLAAIYDQSPMDRLPPAPNTGRWLTRCSETAQSIAVCVVRHDASRGEPHAREAIEADRRPTRFHRDRVRSQAMAPD